MGDLVKKALLALPLLAAGGAYRWLCRVVNVISGLYYCHIRHLGHQRAGGRLGGRGRLGFRRAGGAGLQVG